MLRKCQLFLFAVLLAGTNARVAVMKGMILIVPSTAAFIKPSRHCKRYDPVTNRHHRLCQQIRTSKNNGMEVGGDNNESERVAGADDKRRDNRVKTRFRARVSYFGTPFSGWQLQPDKTTIQGEIEGVLTRRFIRRTPVLGAGRTDGGVHARGQAIHFDLFPEEIPFLPPPKPTTTEEADDWMDRFAAGGDELQKCTDFCNELQHSMNRMLPMDIRVFNLQLAPYTIWPASEQSREDGGNNNIDVNPLDNARDGEELLSQQPTLQLSQIWARPWHVIQSAKSKWYSYRFALGPSLWNPKERFTRTHFIHRPMFSNVRAYKSASMEPYALTKDDIDRLQSILRLYEGTHDFKAFGGQLEQNEKKIGMKINTVRTVHRVELVKEPLKEDDYFFGSDGINENMISIPSQAQLGFIGEEGNYRIDFLLQGALYKMVRNMVGTAIQVWLGRMPEEHLVELLQIDQQHGTEGDTILGVVEEPQPKLDKKKKTPFRRKDNPCKPAPPEGLTLECVYYDDQF